MSRRLTCLAAVGLVIALAGSAGAQLGQGKVLFEYWDGVGGTSVDGNLRTLANFPDNPSSSEWRDKFQSKANRADNYGVRARAFLTAPETGEYTFWVAGDDNCQLWLSTDDTAANATMIAQVASWTGVAQWTKEAGQKSAPVALVAGQKYYIEALMKEGGGGDSLDVGWAGPGIGDKTVVLAGQYCTAFVRDPEPLFKAQNPDPKNGAIEVTNPLFTWTAGVVAASHEVYVGSSPVLGPNDFVGVQPMAMYYHLAGLTPAAKYYWRVDEVDAGGAKYEGNVWSFTVMPIQSYNHSPYDGAMFRDVAATLSWKAGSTAASHDVYLGTSLEDVNAAAASVFMGNQAGTTFDPNGLAYGTTYYWRVDEIDSAGQKIVGDVLSFSTMAEGMGGATFEVWSNIAGGSINDLLNDVNFPRNPSTTAVVSNMEAPTDYNDAFGGRISAWLHVPVAGEYTFWVASDDDSQLFLGADKNSAKLIASVTGWAGVRAWDSMASQKSAAIQLNEGVYYLAAQYKEGSGGDNCSVAWQGPAVPVRELVSDGFITPFVGLWADDASPADGAQGQPDQPAFDWMAGVGAVEHVVYLGTDKGKVEAGDASVLQVRGAETSFVPASPLKWNTTYYWKVDEVDADGNVNPGFVWSLKVADYIPVIDGAVVLNYDNTADPFITELAQEYVAPQDFTRNGATSLQLQLKGNTQKLAINGGTISLMGAGADIWNNADEFRYAYKTLNGDGSMIARVVSVGTGSSEWSKGGVMIRASTAAGSTHAFMPITGPSATVAAGGNGASFQRRMETNGGSSNADSPTRVAAPPYWVKIDRVGDTFTGSISADANEWTPLGDPIVIDMNDPVLIGLAVTSHTAGELRTFQFDGVATTGDVTGDWTVADIGVAQGGNDPAPVYVALVDSDGKTAAVSHPNNPNITTDAAGSAWKVLLSSFSGVNLKAITKVVVGVGNGQAGGTGVLEVADVRVVKPVTVTVTNPSFEQPNAGAKQLFAPPGIRFQSVPGWNTDKEPANSSVRKDASPSNGSWAACLWGGDPSIWQITDYVVTEGEAFQLDVDSAVVMGAVKDGVGNLKISLCYLNDDGKRVTLASSSFAMPVTVKGYSLSISSSQAHAAAGHKLGIELANVRDNVIGVDNVRLKTK